MSENSAQTNCPNVQICHLNPQMVTRPELIERFTTWLDITETTRLKRLVNPQHRHTFLVSHALTRKLLANALGCEPREIRFGFTGRDKPVLALPLSEHAIHFNLSHTNGMVVVAIGSEPLGVDVESITRQTATSEVAKRYFTENERADIEAQPEDLRKHRFLTYWTLKEAFLKAQAWGIVDRLDGFEFELNSGHREVGGRIQLRIHDAKLTPTHPWRFHHWAIQSSHLISLAVSARLPETINVQPTPWREEDWH